MKAEKILEYLTAFFLLIAFSMSASRWMQGVDFFPVWLIIIFFILSVLSLYFFMKFKNKPEQNLPPLKDSEAEKEREKKRQRDYEEIWRQEKEAHNLVVKLCESKNIRLTLKQEGKSGHCEIPEIWTLGKAVPLTPDELYAITANETLHADTKLHADGIIYAEKFTRGGGWTVYEQEN